VRIPGLGYQVGFFPFSSRPTRALPRTDEGVVIGLHGPGIGFVGSGPTSVRQLRSNGIVVSANVGDGTNRVVVVVPDGVTKVTLTALRFLHQPQAHTANLVTSISPVDENVVLFQLSSLTAHSVRLTPTELAPFFSMNAGRGCKASYAVYALPASALMTWSDPDGSVIRRQTIDFPLYISAQHPRPGTTPPNTTCPAAR
jgi:hypothetical protein